MDVVRETHRLLEPHLCRKEVMASIVHEGGAYAGHDHSELTGGDVEFIGIGAGMWLSFPL